MFTGFTQETSDFFWELQFHNERPWFEEHKARYRRAVAEPFAALANETLDRFTEAAPDYDWTLHLSRIYRDARRLFGRGPYKDHLWFSIQEGRDWAGVPCFWFEISAGDFGRGMGWWDVSAAQMAAYRRRIDADPAGFARMIRELTADGRFSDYNELYKRPKKDVGEFLNPWYNCRRPGVGCEQPFGGEALTAELPALLTEDFCRLLPYYEFLRGLAAL